MSCRMSTGSTEYVVSTHTHRDQEMIGIPRDSYSIKIFYLQRCGQAVLSQNFAFQIISGVTLINFFYHPKPKDDRDELL